MMQCQKVGCDFACNLGPREKIPSWLDVSLDTIPPQRWHSYDHGPPIKQPHTIAHRSLAQHSICVVVSSYSSAGYTHRHSGTAINQLHKVHIVLVRQERAPGSLQLIKPFHLRPSSVFAFLWCPVLDHLGPSSWSGGAILRCVGISSMFALLCNTVQG